MGEVWMSYADGPLVPMKMLEGAALHFRVDDPVVTHKRVMRSLTHSAEMTLEIKHINRKMMRLITGTSYNNELRMMHRPMRRRRTNVKKARWRILKAIRTHRGNLNDKIRGWRRMK